MRCPSCSSVMAVEYAGCVAVDICRACPAVWLDAGELEALRVSRHSALGPLPAATHGFQPQASAAWLTCPSCASGRLQPGTVDTKRLMLCDSCRGLFLPLSQFPRRHGSPPLRTPSTTARPAPRYTEPSEPRESVSWWWNVVDLSDVFVIIDLIW